jgi:hypothetical protein
MPRDRKTARKSTGGAALCKKVRIEEVPKEQEIAPVGVQSEQTSHTPSQAVPPLLWDGPRRNTLSWKTTCPKPTPN